MNWKHYVAQQNAKAFTLPPGWDSRESIAEQLECSPEKVREHLQPGIASKAIECRSFPVWDGQLGRKIAVTAYRRIEHGTDNALSVHAPKAGRGKWSDVDTSRALEMRRGGASLSVIGRAVGRSKTTMQLWFKNQGA